MNQPGTVGQPPGSHADQCLDGMALENNLVWLASFGCEIQRWRRHVLLTHARRQEYCAWLLFGPQEEATAAVRSILAEEAPAGTYRDIYIDRDAEGPPVRTRLTTAGYEASVQSVTIGGHLRNVPSKSPLRLRMATEGDMPRWASIYSTGFGRVAADAEVDVACWMRAFRNEPRVTHWFLVENEVPIGVFQTCWAHGIVGIYSVALLPEKRSITTLRAAISAGQTLRNGFGDIGQAPIYFEVLRPLPQPAKSNMLWRSLGLQTLREMVGWRHRG